MRQSVRAQRGRARSALFSRVLLRYGLWQRVSFWLLSVLYLKLSVAPCSLEGQLKQFNVFVFSQQVTSSTYEEAF